jgi:uncharacterized membrane-anchored protein
MRHPRSLLFLLGLTLATAAASGRDARADAPAPRPSPAAPAKGTPKPQPAAPEGESEAPAPAGSAAAEPSEAEMPPEVKEYLRQFNSIDWKKGPTTGDLVNAEIKVPEGFLFTYGEGAKRFMELNHNPAGSTDFGVLLMEEGGWFIVFEFDDSGHVPDDEKDEIKNADEILQSLREGTEQGNAARRSRGWDPIAITGWASPPRYEPTTKNLEWATNVENTKTKHVSVNHNIRILGRSGVMEATLIDQPETYAATLPKAREVLQTFSYKAGSRYSEWRPGEKVAEYGLIGLMTGGAVAVAAKTGLLAKFGKVLGKGIVAIGAGLSALFARIFKRGNKQNEQG